MIRIATPIAYKIQNRMRASAIRANSTRSRIVGTVEHAGRNEIHLGQLK
ncbi:hypothetical protein B0E55_01662 [Rhodococcus sp. 66b]|nr:hypothetical protein B0E55_01662 [Rhodococcus sp. 66b]